MKHGGSFESGAAARCAQGAERARLKGEASGAGVTRCVRGWSVALGAAGAGRGAGGAGAYEARSAQYADGSVTELSHLRARTRGGQRGAPSLCRPTLEHLCPQPPKAPACAPSSLGKRGTVEPLMACRAQVGCEQTTHSLLYASSVVAMFASVHETAPVWHRQTLWPPAQCEPRTGVIDPASPRRQLRPIARPVEDSRSDACNDASAAGFSTEAVISQRTCAQGLFIRIISYL